MTLLVRDEEDIIEENIEFHLLQGVDFFIVMDNNSRDKTKKILKRYEEQGVLKYYFKEDDIFKQEEWVTFMSKEATTVYNADWIINNDADEFWFPKYNKSLKEVFEGLGRNKNLLVAERSNFIVIQNESSTPFYSTMIYKEILSKNPKGIRLSPKVAYKASSSIVVSHGNHGIDSGLERILPVSDLIDILHFPIRNTKQYENKIVNIGSGLYRNKKHTNNVRALFYNKFQKDKLYLQDRFDLESYSYKEILMALNKGILIEDSRLKNILETLFENKK
jgi:hypothetical protein